MLRFLLKVVGGRAVPGEVLLIAEAPIATVQLVEAVLDHLEATDVVRSRLVIGEIFGKLELREDSFPLIVRSCDFETYQLTRVLRAHGIEYGFYLDDNFWLLDPHTPLGRHYRSRPIQRQLNWIVQNASLVIAASPLLRDYVSTRNANAVAVQSHFDFALVPQLPPTRRRHGVRGGFAGSAHRGADIQPIVDALVRMLDKHQDLEFEFIGPSGNLPMHERIRMFPYHETYEEYVAFQMSRAWDFGLAPLGPAESNMYKTNNKYREYAAQGIPGIYEEAPPYADVIDGVTGLIAGQARTWEEAMERMVAEPGLRNAIRTNARRDLEVRGSLSAVADVWHSILVDVPEAGHDPQRFASARAAILEPPSRQFSRRARRHALETAAWIAVAENGFWTTAARGIRFLARELVRRVRSVTQWGATEK